MTSFDESSYAESLQAPSMAESRIRGQSIDLESLAGMSALDNVRLSSVFQFDQDDKSIVSTDTGMFSKIWNGNKRKIVKESSIRKISPSAKDTPIKSPIKNSPPSTRSKGRTPLGTIDTNAQTKKE